MRRQQKPAQTMIIHPLGHRYSFFLLFICLSILLTYVLCISRLYLRVALPSLTADPDMLQFMQYNINQYDASKGETYRLAKEFGQYQRSDQRTSDVQRWCVTLTSRLSMFIINLIFLKLLSLLRLTEGSVVKALPEISSDQKNRIKSLYEGVVRSLNDPDSNPRSTPRSRHSSSVFHYLLWQDVATEYASADTHYYPYYESVNAAVARRIAEVYRTGDLIWVHDYGSLYVGWVDSKTNEPVDDKEVKEVKGRKGYLASCWCPSYR